MQSGERCICDTHGEFIQGGINDWGRDEPANPVRLLDVVRRDRREEVPVVQRHPLRLSKSSRESVAALKHFRASHDVHTSVRVLSPQGLGECRLVGRWDVANREHAATGRNS